MLALLVVFVRVFGDWGDYWRRGGNPDGTREISVLAAVAALVYGLLFMFAELAALSAVQEGKPSSVTRRSLMPRSRCT